jgi:superfamily II DNA or RNA helicase
MFKVNDRVTIPSRGNVRGTVVSIDMVEDIVHLGIMLDTSEYITIKEEDASQLVLPKNSLQMLKNGKFSTKEVFMAEFVINKLGSRNNDMIATLRSSRTIFYPYQFIPLLKFLKSESRRILIADEVGLGKTIEAGYILAEMCLRGMVKRCLVICKASLKEKWKRDLEEKFGFQFDIYSRQELMQSIEEDIRLGYTEKFSIINFDYRQNAIEELMEVIKRHDFHFDMVIIDEAHAYRNEANIRYPAIKEILAASKYALLLTATPVMTSLLNLYSLVKLIENRYDDYALDKYDFGYSLFRDHLSLSRPFIIALNKLSRGEHPKSVLNAMKDEKVTFQFSSLDGSVSNEITVMLVDRFKEDALFTETIRMADLEEYSPADIALLQKNLSELNSFQDVITRTTKRQIQSHETKRVIRFAQKISIQFSVTERRYYDSIIKRYDDDRLVLSQKKKQVTSSLPAYMLANDPEHPDLEEILNNDSKYQSFKNIILTVVVEEKRKLIVFSFYRNTIDYLYKKLTEEGISCAVLNGSVNVNLRQDIISNFRDSDVGVLLSTEVGAEGLDIQFCNVIVNYDLPWNPMVVEQRIGRIDRIGQKQDKIYIYNLCIYNTIEEEIYDRLYMRIKIFEESIGALEDILSSETNLFDVQQGLEQFLYGVELTEEAKENKLKELDVALERIRLMKEQIDQELNDSILSDQYISSEVRKINSERRYITDGDIVYLLTLLFQRRLATLRCDFTSSEKYIRWDEGNVNDLLDFISQNIPPIYDNPQLNRQFIEFRRRVYMLNGALKITFSQQEAFEDRSLEFISTTHPLAQAAFYYFKSIGFIGNNAYHFTLQKKSLPESLSKYMFFVLARYKLEEIRQNGGSGMSDTRMSELSLIYSINDKYVFYRIPESDEADFLTLDVESWEVNTDYMPTERDSERIHDVLRPTLINEHTKEIERLKKRLSAVHISKCYRIIDTEIDFINRQLERDEEIVKRDPANPIRFVLFDRRQKYEHRLEELSAQRKGVRFQMHDSLQSISLIQVLDK